MTKDFTNLSHAPAPKDELASVCTDQDPDYQFTGAMGNARELLGSMKKHEAATSSTSSMNPKRVHEHELNSTQEVRPGMIPKRRSSVFEHEDYKKEMYNRSNIFE